MPIVSMTIDGDYLVEKWKNGKVTRRPKDEIITDLYLGGQSEQAIANKFQIGRRVVYRVLIDNGIDRRGCHEAQLTRWIGSTEAQRRRQVVAANDACRCRTRSFNELCLGALARQNSPSTSSSPLELKLYNMLVRRGLKGTRQTAIGPYNCDIAVDGVAVEVWGGKWHFGGSHFARFGERTRYILNAGWNELIVVVIDGRFPLTSAVADYVASYVKQTSRKPPLIREYRVVWGAGEFTTGGRADDDEITVVVPFTSRRNPRTGQYETIPR